MVNFSLALGCSPTADSAFGPIVHTCRDDFDFTITFEQYIFALLPASAILIAAPLRLRHLSKLPATVAGHALKYTKLAAILAFAALELTLAILWATQPAKLGGFRTASIAASFVSLAASLMFCALSYAEHAKSKRPSMLLNAYLLVSALLDGAIVRTFWLADLSTPIRAIFTTAFALKLLVLVLEAKEKREYLVHGAAKGGSPEATAGLYSQGFFWWLNPLLLNGFQRVLKPEDLYAMDEDMATALLNQRFAHAWDNCKCTPAKLRKHRLIRVCLSTLKWPILSVVVPRLFLVVFTILQPLLLNSLLDFLQEADAPARIGYGLIGAYGLVYLGISLSASFYSYRNYRFVAMLRGMLMSAVFAKCTDIKITTEDSAAPVTLMSTDVDAITRAVREIHDFWAALFQIALAAWLLSSRIGYAAAGPIAVCLASLGGTVFLGPFAHKYMMAWVGKVQKRISITSTVLGHMKSIKMSGLGPKLATTIADLRQDEINTARPFRALGAVTSSVALLPKMISTVVGFALFCIHAVRSGETLDVTRMFSALSLILLLGGPLFLLFETVLDLSSARGCITRIEKFLQEGVREDYRTPRIPAPSGSRLGPLVDIDLQEASFSWAPSAQPVVKNVSLSVQKGQFAIIVGPVASGKSTLLKGLLGEISLSSGEVTVARSKLAWCEQTPWLINDTVRKNIIGFSHFDPELYQQVIKACDLEKDFAQLEKGDETNVGSKGAALSGGQKQRVAIARAVYSRPEIALFDDVFSGLDNHTTKIVFKHVFSKKDGLLPSWGTTIVVATQAVKLLPAADLVLALSKEGEVAEQGRPTDLLKTNDSVVKTMLGDQAESHDSDFESTELAEDTSEAEAAQPAKAVATVSPNQAEDKKRQTGDITIYFYFFSKIGVSLTVVFLVVEVLWAFMSTFPTVWLEWWAESNTEAPNQRIGYYLGGYAGLQVAGILSSAIAVWVGMVLLAARAGVQLHLVLLNTVMRAPLSLFTTTDIGSITNRFSQDIGVLDRALPLALVVGVSNVFIIAGMGVLMALSTGYVAISFPFLIGVFYCLQMSYLRTSRQLRFLDLEEKAPVYTQFLETVSGLVTIRAFGWGAQARELNHQLVDRCQKPFYFLLMIQQWLTLVLDLVVTGLALLVVGLAVGLRESVSAGLAGVSLVQLITFAETIKVSIQFWTSLETSLGAVARIREFSQTVRDENLTGEGNQGPPPQSWPSRGDIEINNISASYELDGQGGLGNSDLASIRALDGITLSFAAGEKIGICGRTGSGKSSFLLSMVRLLDLSSGSITVDSLDLSTLHREDIRSRIIAITQDHFALPGTTRENIDPLGAASTEEIEGVLEKVGLWDAIQEKGGLDGKFGDDILSHGQRQLFSLARAILRKNVGRVVLLDEATSSVDRATDEAMQQLIREHFAEHTVISIAHRLETIADFDRVIVLEKGCVVEDGKPSELLASGKGRFKALWDASLGAQSPSGSEEGSTA
ncbi:multidrug resistance-like protein [Thozetella sp. PMI_491]|nr:multidrug resistance-like protein [Thozetella sp. PMI_491]